MRDAAEGGSAWVGGQQRRRSRRPGGCRAARSRRAAMPSIVKPAFSATRRDASLPTCARHTIRPGRARRSPRRRGYGQPPAPARAHGPTARPGSRSRPRPDRRPMSTEVDRADSRRRPRRRSRRRAPSPRAQPSRRDARGRSVRRARSGSSRGTGVHRAVSRVTARASTMRGDVVVGSGRSGRRGRSTSVRLRLRRTRPLGGPPASRRERRRRASRSPRRAAARRSSRPGGRCRPARGRSPRPTPSMVNPIRSATRREAWLPMSARQTSRSMPSVARGPLGDGAAGPGGHAAPAGGRRGPVAEFGFVGREVEPDEAHRAQQIVRCRRRRRRTSAPVRFAHRRP